MDESNAEGTLVEAPKAPKGVDCGEGFRPSPEIFFII